ncbi:MAG: protein-glutamate O-methyltransferase family protein [Spirochaetaceae bacterium]|nr:MAG: protein-glutamate O-methyltransferase family protein [Spirochaetaceae bacterium]
MSPNPSHPPAPVITTADPDSFAAFTLTRRLPALLDQVMEKNRLSGARATPLRDLKRRLRAGTVEDIFSAHPYLRERMETAEQATWSREIGRHRGKSWLNLPWYFAESLFYLEVLLAWGYYREDSPGFAVDPYRPFKEEELRRPGGALELSARIEEVTSVIASPRQQLPILLQYCLWANRLDLSYSQLVEKYGNRLDLETNRLLVDHSDLAAERLLRARRIDLILDNCASELIADLHLVRALLTHASEPTVVLHCKKAPYYVSDATISDATATIAALVQNDSPILSNLGQALSRALEDGSLRLREHFFWNGPLHFPELPAGLKRELSESDLIVLKGDANYRRLLCDRRWDPSTDMKSIVGYFPAAFVTLRTTKSELIVDLPRETVEILNRDDPNWLIEGRYGIIRYCDPGN